MKKLLAVVLAVMLMMTMGLSVTANEYISPEGGVIPDDPGDSTPGTDDPNFPDKDGDGIPDDEEDPGDTNDSPTSPQTGHTYAILVAGVAVACLVIGGVATKKLITEG